jgi:hypothetical protein
MRSDNYIAVAVFTARTRVTTRAYTAMIARGYSTEQIECAVANLSQETLENTDFVTFAAFIESLAGPPLGRSSSTIASGDKTQVCAINKYIDHSSDISKYRDGQRAWLSRDTTLFCYSPHSSRSRCRGQYKPLDVAQEIQIEGKSDLRLIKAKICREMHVESKDLSSDDVTLFKVRDAPASCMCKPAFDVLLISLHSLLTD